jgi:hypothetical protein
MKIARSMFALILALAGCSQQAKQATSATETRAPVIVKVISRDVTITARAGENGPVYSVQSKTGETVVSDQTLDQLQASEPRLARHISGMQAGTWAGLD